MKEKATGFLMMIGLGVFLSGCVAAGNAVTDLAKMGAHSAHKKIEVMRMKRKLRKKAQENK